MHFSLMRAICPHNILRFLSHKRVRDAIKIGASSRLSGEPSFYCFETVFEEEVTPLALSHKKLKKENRNKFWTKPVLN
jgi:hypothetical protein